MKKRAFFGLGNPGEKYALTRHNVGYRIVQALAAHLKAPAFSVGRYASVSQHTWRGVQWYFFLPTTYMNLSGDAVAYWREKLSLELSELIVITDEIQLPVGAMRLTPKGSHGGHNGLSHIIHRLGSDNFPRLRIGIGKDFARGGQSEYVLSPFTPEQEAIFQSLIPHALDCLMRWTTEGINLAMNFCNRRRHSTPSPSSTRENFESK
ncbi:MAG: aminoacyl-tRNA hydrolase [Bacteroidia bacterium]|nr:aminoacyl-tRNA hydrolase [Bacteroidia bacterium]